MGLITNIVFKEDILLNDTKIRAGMSTQVRWDLGVGEIHFDGKGKIMSDVWHGYPLQLAEKELYQKELANWTGIFDTNMGVLFVKEGQLVNLDLSYQDVGNWIINNSDFDWQPVIDLHKLYRTMPVKAFEYAEEVLKDYRMRLTKESSDDSDEKYAFRLAQEKYKNRLGELIDPFYGTPTLHGIIQA